MQCLVEKMSLMNSQFTRRKVEGCLKEVEKLSMFAVTQPHAAYAAFTHGLV